jgi:hypothetical protein
MFRELLQAAEVEKATHQHIVFIIGRKFLIFLVLDTVCTLPNIGITAFIRGMYNNLTFETITIKLICKHQTNISLTVQKNLG